MKGKFLRRETRSSSLVQIKQYQWTADFLLYRVRRTIEPDNNSAANFAPRGSDITQLRVGAFQVTADVDLIRARTIIDHPRPIGHVSCRNLVGTAASERQDYQTIHALPGATLCKPPQFGGLLPL